MTTIRVAKLVGGGMSAHVPPLHDEMPPMAGAGGQTVAEAVAGVLWMLHRDRGRENHTYRDGSRGHLPADVQIEYVPGDPAYGYLAIGA